MQVVQDQGVNYSSDKVAWLPCEQPGLSCRQHLDLHPTSYWDSIWLQCLFPASCKAVHETPENLIASWSYLANG